MTAKVEFQQILEHDVPSSFRVPGGVAAIVKEGEVVAKHVWGYANLDTRELMTSSTIFPICSISKQCVEKCGPPQLPKIFMTDIS